MDVKEKIIVVTGGASGIGRALCLRFAKEGAKGVAVADIDEAGAKAVAGQIDGLAVHCDVRKEEDIIEVVRQTEEKIGPIDMFCSNAGIFIRGSVEVDNESWRRIIDINVMAHIYAARAVIPGMIERGGGYLLHTASAAGLLTQIGSAPYSLTKFAAVGLAENLAIEYADRGIKVSVICPQAVRTAMAATGADVAAVNGLMEPDTLADAVMEGLSEDRFLILPHKEVETYVKRKAGDHGRWLGGMQRLRQRYMEKESAD
ncbi:SDR family oxidoreductase [Thermodesulfobacteriota bacterium]